MFKNYSFSLKAENFLFSLSKLHKINLIKLIIFNLNKLNYYSPKFLTTKVNKIKNYKDESYRKLETKSFKMRNEKC